MYGYFGLDLAARLYPPLPLSDGSILLSSTIVRVATAPLVYRRSLASAMEVIRLDECHPSRRADPSPTVAASRQVDAEIV
jgi:hypothetical protein